ncbi:beta-glucosidase 24-like protein [Tanacetum coccineum]
MQKFAITPTSEYPNGRVLPKFSLDQHKNLIASYDFLGINYYTASFAQYQEPSDEIPLGFDTDCHTTHQAFHGTSFCPFVPEQFTESLMLLKKYASLKMSSSWRL